MSIIETISDIGTILTLLGILGFVPLLFVMNNNITNPNFPMQETAIFAIKGIIMVVVPTGVFGYLFLGVDALSAR